MIYDDLIRELRALLPEYMAQKRILIGGKRNRMIRCINSGHQDHKPSMSFNRSNDTLHCFGCNVTYDLFQVIAMDYPECDSFPRQVKKACDIFGKQFPDSFGSQRSDMGTVQAVKPPAAQTRQLPAEDHSGADYSEMIAREIGKRGSGGSYFIGRGLSQALCEKYRLYQTEDRVVIPVYAGGRCTCYCARALTEQTQPRYKNSAGSMDIFGSDYLLGEGSGGELFITEAAFDALSVEMCGYKAVALCGVTNVRKFLTLCAANPAAANSYTFVAAGDNDEAGARMNAALIEGLTELKLSCSVLSLPSGTKDINELLQSDPPTLKNALEMAAHADSYQYTQTSAAHAISDLLDASIKRASRKAVSTGFHSFDRVLDGGLYAGLYIIGAISSLGKTSYVLQIADYIAANETDVLYFSLEMSRMELMAKSISRISYQLDPTAQRTDAFTARQVMKFDMEMSSERGILLNRAIETYRKGAAGLYIREEIADIGAEAIRNAVREHIRLRGGVKPVVIVDYLQILQPSDLRATDKQNTDRNVVELKRISRDFDIPVLAISSFNRENYRNAVSMEAFKESGAVEYSSDVLLGLQLSGAGETGFDVNAAKERNPRAVELVLLKNRNGIPYAKIPYEYDAKHSRFEEAREAKKTYHS